MSGRGVTRPRSARRCRDLALSFLLTLVVTSGAAPISAGKRWIYLAVDPTKPARVEAAAVVIQRAAAAGYNGVVVAGWNRAAQDDAAYRHGVERIRTLAGQLGLEIVPAVFPIGDSRGLLAEDPNLAEAVPVRAALFVVHQGVARLEPDPPVHSSPGIGERLRAAGRDGVPETLSRSIRVSPFRQYHVRVEVKAEAVGARAKIVALAGTRALIFTEADVEPSRGWSEIHAVFDSLDNREIEVRFSCNRCRGGTLTWRDPRFEEVGLLNVVRRDGAPLVVRREGGELLQEGRDYAPVADSRMGRSPSPGHYDVWHEPPLIRAPNMPDGARLRVSYYHAVVFAHGKVMICPSERKTRELLRREARRARDLWHAHAYFMNHDEIRVLGWDESCARRHLTPGEIVADDVRQCVRLLRDLDPKAEIYVWSDMFDPNHNARADYYLVNGDLRGAWDGLDSSVVVALWRFDRREQSLAWFASRRQPMLIAGYYDGDPETLRQWLDSARSVPGVVGVMYTTWQNHYADLERFAEVRRAAE